jgi:hypothetical protein
VLVWCEECVHVWNYWMSLFYSPNRVYLVSVSSVVVKQYYGYRVIINCFTL